MPDQNKFPMSVGHTSTILISNQTEIDCNFIYLTTSANIAHIHFILKHLYNMCQLYYQMFVDKTY